MHLVRVDNQGQGKCAETCAFISKRKNPVLRYSENGALIEMARMTFRIQKRATTDSVNKIYIVNSLRGGGGGDERRRK